MNTGNTILVVCAEQIEITRHKLLRQRRHGAVAARLLLQKTSDLVEGLTVGTARRAILRIPSDVPGKTNDADALQAYDFGLFPGNTDELGLMLVTNGDRGRGQPRRRHEGHGGAALAQELAAVRARS